MPTYTLQYTTNTPDIADDNGNTAVQEIFTRYSAEGKITGSDSTLDQSNDVYTQVISFLNVEAYNEWYAEIDAIDTTEPSGVTYIGSGIYAD